MKIKQKSMSFDKVLELARPKHKKPKKPNILFRTLVKILSTGELKKTKFEYSFVNCDKLPDKPSLILMNHSSFIDLKIASDIIYPKPFQIVCTTDGFVGKSWLMRNLGCIPTQKFVKDITLIQDIKYALTKNKTHVLMYPEAGYTFDGCCTTLQKGLSRLVRLLGVPVVNIQTFGAFLHDPLYNGLQLRRVPVSAHVETLFTKEQVESSSAEELSAKLKLAFAFDNFAWQKENGIKITEDFRADGLERILYRCAHCNEEGCMKGEGIKLVCEKCGKSYSLTELGELVADDGNTEFSHIPDWYDWQRASVREELISGKYALDTPVDIGMMVDYKSLYMVGKGRLVHSLEGFHLTGCDGKLDYKQKALASYGLNADYFWYEIGDMISIGNRDVLYYCFPKGGDVVAKTRLAAEELYKRLAPVRKRRRKSAEDSEK